MVDFGVTAPVAAPLHVVVIAELSTATDGAESEYCLCCVTNEVGVAIANAELEEANMHEAEPHDGGVRDSEEWLEEAGLGIAMQDTALEVDSNSAWSMMVRYDAGGIFVAKSVPAEESCWKRSVVGAAALAELSYSEEIHEGDERPT